jgi:oligosaccharyl transferase (archaeosortase A-associated)
MRRTPSAGTVSALAVIVALAFGLRTYFSRYIVFAGGWVKFQGMDAWYHMRLVENLVHHFPHRISFDPYALYPGGQDMAIGPLFDVFIGSFILLVGAPSPSSQLIATVGAYFPAVLGALIPIPVYFIATELFDKTAGRLSAALIAVLPGGLLSVSFLGCTDHHVAESLFCAVTMSFMILAVNRAAGGKLSPNIVRTTSGPAIRRVLAYSLLGGVALGCYLLTWMRGAFLVFLILGWITLQHVLDHVKHRSPGYLCIVAIPCLLTALVMVLPFRRSILYMEYHVESLLTGLLLVPTLSAISFAMRRRKVRPAYYPLVVAVLIGTALGALYLVLPSGLRWFLGESARFTPTGTALTVDEVRPLLLATGSLSLVPIWVRFTTSFFLALISLPLIAYFVIRDGPADKTLLLVWSLGMLTATLGQNRFTYYFVVNAAILSAYLCGGVLEWGGFRSAKSVGSAEDAKPAARSAKGTPVLALAAVFFCVFYPNAGLAIKGARFDLGPDQDWHEALEWMKRNTPDPFPDTDFYYALYKKPAAGAVYHYPASAYGVMSWWDYGYWIVDIARRIPNANPTQGGAKEAASFFTAQDEPAANRWLDKLGSRYVVVDGQLPVWHIPGSQVAGGKFPALAAWAGRSPTEFFEEYYQKTTEAQLAPILVYYPEYYRTMVSRLYLFEGKAVAPENSTWVISFTEKTTSARRRYKEIAYARSFATYREAASFLEAQAAPNYRLVGLNPLMSCVPLEELRHYRLIYRSPTKRFPVPQLSPITFSPLDEISNVEIFAYAKS